IDPTDGSTYEVVSLGRYWDIQESGTGHRPGALQDEGPWPSQEQALRALRQMCQQKERERDLASRVPTSAPRRW
ncbi:MAG TPA: hypothetical protein VFA18_11515, partial [Gemmataceae bacterium]|nr:hypothetical protein [Gemmataceae bacterium]